MHLFRRSVGITIIVALFLLLPVLSILGAIHSQPVLNSTRSALSYESGPDSIVILDNGSFVAHTNVTLHTVRYMETTHIFNVTVSGPNGTTGYVNITVPKSEISNLGQISVYANGIRVSSSNLTVTSNANNYFLYFLISFPKSNNSNQAVSIQPYLLVTAAVSALLFMLLLKTRESQASNSFRTKDQI